MERVPLAIRVSPTTLALRAIVTIQPVSVALIRVVSTCSVQVPIAELKIPLCRPNATLAAAIMTPACPNITAIRRRTTEEFARTIAHV